MNEKINIPSSNLPRIVVIGGGFAGIEFIKTLKNKPYQVILIDKNNYFTFQPLLYQVATAGLEPNSIAYPFRRLFRSASNVVFRMAEVIEVDPEKRHVVTSLGELGYDYLVIANGGRSNYFDIDPDKLLSLKSLNGALDIKNTILHAFELAVEATDPDDREKYLNIVIAGGGPTGVELAGAFGEMKKFVLPKDYPDLDFDQFKIHLLEGQDRLLASMSNQASEKAKLYLEQLSVIVKLNQYVQGYEDNVVRLDNEDIISANLIWSAGIKANVLKGLENVKKTDTGRLKVDEYLRLPGYKNIYAIGDVAALISSEYPDGHPMLAPVAIQQGKFLAKNFLRMAKERSPATFTYRDKGTMATIGRNRAVVDAPWFKIQGTLAWFAWMFVHLVTLVGFRNKVVTLIDWSYNYFTYDRALRLINRRNKTVRKKRKPAKAEPVTS